jgi:hypothetical protein
MNESIAKIEEEIKRIKRDGTHSPACAVKPFGGVGPATWAESDKRRCTCTLGQQLSGLRGLINLLRMKRASDATSTGGGDRG